jgi:hypothetical protein
MSNFLFQRCIRSVMITLASGELLFMEQYENGAVHWYIV